MTRARAVALALLASVCMKPGFSLAQPSAADQVVLRKKNRFGFGVFGLGLTAGPAEQSAFGAGLTLRYMTRDGTFSASPFIVRAADDPGVVRSDDGTRVAAPAGPRITRWGISLDASYNVVRRGRYAVFLGTVVALINNGPDYDRNDLYPANPDYLNVAGQLGFARRIGERGGFYMQLEPGAAVPNITSDDPRGVLFTVQSKVGLFVF